MSNNFYEQDSFPAIEKVTLAEDIEFSSIHDINAKFYIQLLTPNVDTSKIIEDKNGKYQQTNYIILTIPGYMLLSFMKPSLGKIANSTEDKYIFVFNSDKFIIPKGTEFLIEFLGGELKINKISIVGIYNNPYNE